MSIGISGTSKFLLDGFPASAGTFEETRSHPLLKLLMGHSGLPSMACCWVWSRSAAGVGVFWQIHSMCTGSNLRSISVLSARSARQGRVNPIIGARYQTELGDSFITGSLGDICLSGRSGIGGGIVENHSEIARKGTSSGTSFPNIRPSSCVMKLRRMLACITNRRVLGCSCLSVRWGRH